MSLISYLEACSIQNPYSLKNGFIINEVFENCYVSESRFFKNYSEFKEECFPQHVEFLGSTRLSSGIQVIYCRY